MRVINSLIFIFLGVFLANARAELDVEDIKGLYNNFKKEDKHFSPIHGLIALNKIIWNVRFKGLYGEENQQFLCHYQIVKPHLQQSRKNFDCPTDYTTSLLQHVLPSPAGELTLPGSRDDFFKVVPMRQIAELLKLYTAAKEEPLRREDFVKLFNYWFRNSKEQVDGMDNWQLEKKQRSKIIALYKYTEEKNNLANKYAHMFIGALEEANIYPMHFIESLLLALAWKRADIKEDLKPLLEVLSPYQDTEQFDLSAFTKNDYQLFSKNVISSSDDMLNLLSTDPEAFIFTVLAHDKYKYDFYPPLLNMANVEIIDRHGIKAWLQDCGESSLLNFFNIALANGIEERFDAEILRKSFPASIQVLNDFYLKEQPTYKKVKGKKNRLKWLNLLSNLGGDVSYSHDTCNISGKGVDNILAVMEQLLRDDGLSEILNKPLRTDEDRAEAMNYIFSKFSRADFLLSWHINNVSTTLPNDGAITIAINGKDLFTWSFSIGHYTFHNIKSNKQSDWRIENFSIIKDYLPQNSLFDKLVLCFFFSANNISSFISDNVNVLKFDYSTVLYSSNLNHVNIPYIIDRILKMELNSENLNHIKNLSERWLNVSTIDPEVIPVDNQTINTKIISLLERNIDFFIQNLREVSLKRICNSLGERGKTFLHIKKADALISVLSDDEWRETIFVQRCEDKLPLKDEDGNTTLHNVLDLPSRNASQKKDRENVLNKIFSYPKLYCTFLHPENINNNSGKNVIEILKDSYDVEFLQNQCL